MASPGFSLSELIIAIGKCKTLYDAFRGEYENAPARVRELVDTCRFLHDVLEDFKSLLEYHGDIYPQEGNFGRRLDECNAFIESYKSLKEVYLRSVRETKFTAKIHDKWERAWQTTKFAFHNKKAVDLKNNLSLEIQKLVVFILVFALKRTVPANAVPHGRQVIPSQTTRRPNGPAVFESLHRRLQAIQYSHKREMSIAVQQNRQPNLAGIQQDLLSVWHVLCVRAGMAQEEGPTPPLPRDSLLDAPSQNLNELVITLAEPSIHTALRPPLPRGRSPPSPSSVPSTMSTSSPNSENMSDTGSFGTSYASNSANITLAPPMQPNPMPPSIQLPESVLPCYIATITLNIQNEPRVVRLRSWKSIPAGDSHRILWTGEEAGETLDHHLPPNAFPDTLHRSHKDGLSVSFQDVHHLILRTKDGDEHDHFVKVRYIFLSPDDRKDFQGDVRDKDLVESFDFEYLRSKRENGLEASLQNLKVWQDRHYPYRHSISFYASAVSGELIELPFLWFQPTAKRDSEKPRVVYLNFPRRRKSSTGTGERRKSTLGRASSWVFGRPPPNENSFMNSKRASFSSDTSDNLPPGDILDRFKYIAIEFTTGEDADTFVSLFEKLHSEDSPQNFSEPPSETHGSPRLFDTSQFPTTSSDAYFNQFPQ